MEECKVVEHFKTDSWIDGLVDIATKEFACHEHEHGSDAFATQSEFVSNGSIQRVGLLRVFDVFECVVDDVNVFRNFLIHNI